MDIGTIGTILYWCEGSKREEDRRVEFVNSDEKMISVFMSFLRARNVDEGRIRIRMAIHDDEDEASCKQHWKGVTGLDDSNFLQTIVKRPSIARSHLPYGTVTIRYNSIGMLRGLKREISDLVIHLSSELENHSLAG